MTNNTSVVGKETDVRGVGARAEKVAIACSDECVRKEGMRSYERLLKNRR
jgi:hypothetical protein